MSSQSPDTKITFTSPVRAPSSVPVDDAVIPFEVNALDLRGQLEPGRELADLVAQIGEADDFVGRHEMTHAV